MVWIARCDIVPTKQKNKNELILVPFRHVFDTSSTLKLLPSLSAKKKKKKEMDARGGIEGPKRFDTTYIPKVPGYFDTYASYDTSKLSTRPATQDAIHRLHIQHMFFPREKEKTKKTKSKNENTHKKKNFATDHTQDSSS